MACPIKERKALFAGRRTWSKLKHLAIVGSLKGMPFLRFPICEMAVIVPPVRKKGLFCIWLWATHPCHTASQTRASLLHGCLFGFMISSPAQLFRELDVAKMAKHPRIFGPWFFKRYFPQNGRSVFAQNDRLKIMATDPSALMWVCVKMGRPQNGG